MIETEWVKIEESHWEKINRVVKLQYLQIAIGKVRYGLVLLELGLLVFSCKTGQIVDCFPWELVFIFETN